MRCEPGTPKAGETPALPGQRQDAPDTEGTRGRAAARHALQEAIRHALQPGFRASKVLLVL